MRIQKDTLTELKLSYNKGMISMFCYILITILMTVNHIYVAAFSENWNKLLT